jgi:signal transduction histidine kinase
MLRIPFLRNLLLLVLVVAACLPLYTLLVLHPAYREQLVRETEHESVRYANFLLRSLKVEGLRIERGHLPATTIEQSQVIQDDPHLIKLRFFSPGAEIVFSTDPAEIGNVNTQDYFHTIVAKGKIFSKVVEKDKRTADGVLSKVDVVETYVPFMAGERFNGAIEIYSDISAGIADIKALTLRTTLSLVVISFGFVAVIYLALRKAKVALDEQQQAEDTLRQVNEELEERVVKRTAELSAANEQLTAEIAERTLAQVSLSQALEASRRDREKLNGILRSVGDGLVVTDHQLMVLHMNAAAERLLKLPLEKALGQPLDRLSAAANLPGKVRELLDGAQISPVFDFELPGEDPKQPRVYQARFSRLDSDRDETGVVLLIHDVTRERELEQLKNAFLGMAAHELNTPLAAILGFSELLTSEHATAQLSPQQCKEYLLLIHTKALELSRLVDDLLDISRVEAGQPLLLDYEAVRLDDIVREVLHPYQEKSARHHFELHFATAQTQITADPWRIRQVINNLISNAVKYSPQGGLIKVAVESGDGHCRITVADEGIGMTSEQVEHIFDRFYRADSSNTAVHGVGLGMSIVRHIIEAHHGEIRVESWPDRGTRVSVDLPLIPPVREH